jgi:hypothetical protein
LILSVKYPLNCFFETAGEYWNIVLVFNTFQSMFISEIVI